MPHKHDIVLSLKRSGLLMTPPTQSLGPYPKTLPEAQRTQGIDSITLIISPAKNNATFSGSKFGQHYNAICISS